MGKNVEVSCESFGNKKVTRIMDIDDLKTRDIAQTIEAILSSVGSGDDERVVSDIRRNVSSSGGYFPVAYMGGKNLPVKAQPVMLGDPAIKYIQDNGEPNQSLRLSVTGVHVVGY